MTGPASITAAFDRAHRRAVWGAFGAWLTGRRRHLRPLADAVAGRPTAASPTPATGAPTEAVALERIVGSTGDARARDYGPGFLPLRDFDRHRWQRVWQAVAWRGTDPVRLVRFEGSYYVEDGHHRVSAMRALGLRTVEAHVTELRALGEVEPDRRRSPLSVARATPYRGSDRGLSRPC